MLQLAFLWVIGAGWSGWALGERVAAAAAAPAFGVAAVTIAGLTLERLGVPLDGRWGPALASALAAGGGYAIGLAQRKAVAKPPPQVEQAPEHEHEHRRGHDPVSDP